MFLGTVTMLFAAFTSALIVRRGGGDWRPVTLPWVLWPNTLGLLLSSAAVELAARQGRQGHWRSAGAAFGVALALGAGFLAGQAVAWQQLAAAGAFLSSGPHAAFVYTLTGAHGAHVVAAVSVLAWGASLTWAGRGRRDRVGWAAAIGLCRTFWHYLGAVWLYLFLLLRVA
jgi:cytochrome c oxidase subunit 3